MIEILLGMCEYGLFCCIICCKEEEVEKKEETTVSPLSSTGAPRETLKSVRLESNPMSHLPPPWEEDPHRVV